jgi:hypothetical protein
MKYKTVAITLHPTIIDRLVDVKNRSALISRLLCRHFNLNPDTFEPIVDDFTHVDNLENHDGN